MMTPLRHRGIARSISRYVALDLGIPGDSLPRAGQHGPSAQCEDDQTHHFQSRLKAETCENRNQWFFFAWQRLVVQLSVCHWGRTVLGGDNSRTSERRLAWKGAWSTPGRWVTRDKWDIFIHSTTTFFGLFPAAILSEMNSRRTSKFKYKQRKAFQHVSTNCKLIKQTCFNQYKSTTGMTLGLWSIMTLLSGQAGKFMVEPTLCNTAKLQVRYLEKPGKGKQSQIFKNL